MDVSRHKSAFQEALVTWFELEKEDYPWRRTKDPWEILVSEVMLQQTQVATVLGKGFYVNFLKRFPDVQSISVASEQEILKAWEGLGYYRRVRNLQKTAIAVVEEHGGKFPDTHAGLLGLPGVGPYTAGAVASFAYGLPQPLVDANVSRVFSRMFDYHEEVDSAKGIKQMWQWAGDLLDEERPAAYNSALMELGQKICRNKNPGCMLCPVRAYCSTERAGELPKKKRKKATVEVVEQCVWARRGNKILLQQEEAKQRREGMWTLPKVKVDEGERPIHVSKYGITHHKVDLLVYKVDGYRKKKAEQWFEIDELDDVPMPSPFRRVVNALLER